MVIRFVVELHVRSTIGVALPAWSWFGHVIVSYAVFKGSCFDYPTHNTRCGVMPWLYSLLPSKKAIEKEALRSNVLKIDNVSLSRVEKELENCYSFA